MRDSTTPSDQAPLSSAPDQSPSGGSPAAGALPGRPKPASLEEELRQSEANLREAQQIARMGRWEYDLVSRRLTWSEGVFALHEEDPAGFVPSYEAFFDLVHPLDRSMVDRAFRDSVANRTPFEISHRLLMKDGRVKWVNEIGRTYYASDGTPLRTVGVVQDVTERRAAEESLRESETRLRLALYAANQSLFERNLVTGEESASPEYGAMLGYAPGEVVVGAASWPEWIHPDDRTRVQQAIDRYLAGENREYRVECRHRTRDGGWRWLLSVGTTVDWTPDGRPLRMLGIRTDIDERKRTEEALEKRILALTMPESSSETLRFTDLFNVDDLQRIQDAFANATGVAALITEPDGTPITRPTNFCRLCATVIRRSPRGAAACAHSDGVLGRHNPGGPIVQRCLSAGLWGAGASITVGGRHVANWMIGQVKNEGIDEGAVLRYATEIGADPREFAEALAEVPVMSTERFQMVANAVFTFAHELSVKAYQSVTQARFIAERRRADEQRAALESQLQQARKLEAVGRLAGGVAHDLNNMLAPILGYSELLADELPADDDRRAMAVEISSAAARARELVRQLLAFGRKQTIEVEPLDLNHAVRRLLPILRRTTRENVLIELDLAPEVGLVRADPVQIEQVLLNLAANAQDAMPDGGVLKFETSAVTVTDEEARREPGLGAGPHVMLSVHDTGTGMDADTIEHIFDPFFTTKELGKGTGLGLATVYGIVKQHGGAITVESAAGRGTTFRIRFPETADTPKGSAAAAGAARTTGSGTVLVVEDQQQVREFVCRALARSGFTVLQAASGEEAERVSAAHQGPIGLLLTDVVMTSMNGRELQRRLSIQRPGLRVLYMSGYTDDVIGQHGILQDDEHLLQKPFSLGELTAKVCEVMDGK